MWRYSAIPDRWILIFALAFVSVVSPKAAVAKYVLLHSFAGGGDGSNPFAGLIRTVDGSLYGTTAFSGTTGNGTVFKLAPDGTETQLYSFAGGTDGAIPYGRLLIDSSGTLFG